MKLEYPGLIKERMKSGNIRYRVRPEGDKARRINLHVTPDHKEFQERYEAGRAGIQLPPPDEAPRVIKYSLEWLIDLYLDDCERAVKAGLMAPLTLKKKRGALKPVKARFGAYDMMMPRSQIITLRDEKAETPAAADDLMKHLSTMYTWAIDKDFCTENPVAGIKKIHRSKGGAVAWSVNDLKKYRAFHPPGTTAHLALTILMFTAGRISDAAILGREHEFMRDGIRGLGWQPPKKGASFVQIPMLEPLYRATRAAKVQGKTYLLNAYGKPYSSADALSQRFSKWCRQAGLENRTAHGVRKGFGKLLAEDGATQYQIMAIHGHAEAQTSEIYTRDAERWRMAKEAITGLDKIAAAWDTL
ncbi:MAG: integrase [Oceanicaulis sp.]|nr:tyrosine-type recombinase/integrase [Oceanicaulis sp. UBA6590]MBC38938.1 integrase [Oceanicaulis sp.]MBG37313.1 integrase [Oceanicaulis sp.]HBU61572.1 integrase [Oceanicaulis sp.]|tara:strand:- start:1849 stop:2925 length:1077 start_codon:yes stop_codon:yes gene_type:complete